MKIIAIIPARAGSKGIPRKNLKMLNGIPLIAYSIIAANQSKMIEKVIVSTNDNEIAEVSTSYGAEIVLRPNEISNDTAQSEDAILHCIDLLKSNFDYIPDLIVFLQATSPLRKKTDIDGAIQKLIESGADSLFSANVEHFCGRWQKDKNDALVPQNYSLENRPMRQDYPIEYFENGSIYVFRLNVIRSSGLRLGGKVETFQMPLHRSIQIDSEADFAICEKLISFYPHYHNLNFKNIKLLVLDFDGVMTDNHVYVDQNGKEMVKCDRGDGLGLSKLKKANIDVIVLSTEKNPVVNARCEKLGIESYQGCTNKIINLKKIANEKGLSPREIAFLGNDINDLDCLNWVGIPIAVADSYPPVIKSASMITSRKGGDGAIREVSDWIIALNNE